MYIKKTTSSIWQHMRCKKSQHRQTEKVMNVAVVQCFMKLHHHWRVAEAIEVCYSSVLVELHRALNHSHVHHFFWVHLKHLWCRYLQRVSVFACCDFLQRKCHQIIEVVFLICTCFFYLHVFLICSALSSLCLRNCSMWWKFYPTLNGGFVKWQLVV